jgi:hypothetical protein
MWGFLSSVTSISRRRCRSAAFVDGGGSDDDGSGRSADFSRRATDGLTNHTHFLQSDSMAILYVSLSTSTWSGMYPHFENEGLPYLGMFGSKLAF